MRICAYSLLICLIILSSITAGHTVTVAADEGSNPTLEEAQVISMINGTSAYDYCLELERIALDHNYGYSFRSSGSQGATESAEWIAQQFENMGLETTMEPFEFTTWNVLSPPSLRLYVDGNASSNEDQVEVQSFQPEHYCWPTSEGGVEAPLVTLPMPDIPNRAAIMGARYDPLGWNAVNITGKILFIGREIRWTSNLMLVFYSKIKAQPPAAVILTWWYSWMSWVPPMFGSTGGRPASSYGAYFWNQHIPVGWVDYEDGQMIRSTLTNNTSVRAQVYVNAWIGQSAHYNVVAKLPGSTDPEKMVMMTAHYDSVVTAGFCDNGAGTAGILELARVFSDATRQGIYKPRNTLLFVAFAGEELGLVGSINYLKKHAAEMKNVIAVINIDCIGSDLLQITETVDDDNGVNLQDIAIAAAQDLGVKVDVISPEEGASDQETFRSPKAANEGYKLFWTSDSGISNLTRVKSSIIISSYPIFYSDLWDNGTAGWIHTSYDNSTSTSTLNWVEIDDLQAQLRVTGLVVIRVLSTNANSLLSSLYAGTAVTVAVAALIIYIKRKKVTMLARKLRHEILISFGVKELVFVVILTTIFLLLSFTFSMRIGRGEVDIYGFPSIVSYRFYGKPFEMIAIADASIAQSGAFESLQQNSTPDFAGTFSILWGGLLGNLVVFGLLALISVYVVIRLVRLAEYRSLSSRENAVETEG
jgi:hypothetical protein